MSTRTRQGRGRRSPQYLLLQAILKRMTRKHAEAPVDLPRMRRGLETGLLRLGRAPASSVTTTTRVLAGIPCLELTPHRETGETPILYVHGGGYTLGSSDAYSGVVSRICTSLGRRVIMPDYRLAPEHPYPAALEDLEAVIRALAPHAPETPLAVMGDSAGGGLALALTKRLSQSEELPTPRCLVLYCPWVDLRCESASMESGATTDWVVRSQWLRTFARMYSAERPLDDPQLSPLLGEHAGLPPTLLEVGGFELLRDDARTLAARLESAGVTTSFHEDPKGIHVWQIYLPWLPEAVESMHRTRSFLETHAD